MIEDNINDDLSEDMKDLKLDPINSSRQSIPSIKNPPNFKISLTPDISTNATNMQSLKTTDSNRQQNMNFLEIEKLIKKANSSTLKKFSSILEKKMKYSTYNDNELNKKNNLNNINKINKTGSEMDCLKMHQTRESTHDNSDKNYIHNDFDESKLLNEKIYEKIIKNNSHIKYRSKNNSKGNKRNEITLKFSLETIHSRGDTNLNYNKFENAFLNINDSKSILNNMTIKNTNNSLLKLLSFLSNEEILNLFCVNEKIRSSITGCLTYKVKEKIIPSFNSTYCSDIIFNDDYNFMILAKLYKKKKRHLKFILSLKPKITKNNKKLINKRIKISFSEIIRNVCNKEMSSKYHQKEKIKVNTSYLFDIIERVNPKYFWVFSENTSFHYDDFKAYYNNIMQFWPGDKALININLLSEVGIMDFDSFNWEKPKIIKKSGKNNFDSINKCEVEQVINDWNKLSSLIYCKTVEKNIKSLFGDYFIIKDIFYDDVGYFFFKIILEANIVGTCTGKDGNLGIKINILPIESNITNEVKKNGLIFDENNELAVNVKDILTFYISQNKDY